MIARLFFITPALVLAFLLTGCAESGYSPEVVRKIREIDRELCDVRMGLLLTSLSTVAPPGNDEGMDLSNNN